MSNWINKCEDTLTEIGIQYDFERFNCNTSQLPDTYITYFLVDDIGKTWADGVETSHEPRIQVSLYYRHKSTVLTVPEQIEAAFVSAGFIRAGGGRIPYQPDTRHYGWRCDFRISERR